MRARIVFFEDLRKELDGYRLIFCLFVFQVLQVFVLYKGRGSAPTEVLLEEAFYLTSVSAGVIFSVFGSVALMEEEKQGTLPTLFLAPITLRQYLGARLSFPLFSWLLAWLLVLLNINLMGGSIGTVTISRLAASAGALFLMVAGTMLLTILVATILRDTRPAILMAFSLVFLHLVVVRPLFFLLSGESHTLLEVFWFLPFLHADRVWIWALQYIQYEEIAISPGLEILWLGVFCILMLSGIFLVLWRRYHRSIE